MPIFFPELRQHHPIVNQRSEAEPHSYRRCPSARFSLR